MGRQLRRRGAIALTLLAIGAVTACGDDGDDGGDASGASTEKVKVGVVIKTLENPYWVAGKAGFDRAKREIGADAEVLFDTGTSEERPEEQITKIENMLTRGIDALAVAPTNPDLALPVLQRAVDEGVKVILVDTDIPDWDGETSFIGTDNVEAGRLAGEFLDKQLGGKGKVGLIAGLKGVTSVDNREAGFKEALQDTDIEIVGDLDTTCLLDKGVSVAEDILTADPDVDAMFSECGPPAVGAIQAIRGAGKTGEIFLMGFDAAPDEIAAILSGEEDATVAQFPERMVNIGTKLAVKAAKGEKVPPTRNVGVEIITKKNAAEFQEYVSQFE